MYKLISILLLFSLTIKGQSIDIETEHIKPAKKVEIKYYNGCVKNGFRTIYTFNDRGQIIDCKQFFKKELRAKFNYVYNEVGLLTEKIEVYDINNKNRVDSTHYSYETDTKGRMLSKTMLFGNNRFYWKYYYKDFNEYGFPKMVISENERKEKNIQQITYDTLGNILLIQKIENDSIITIEERKYNNYSDIVYSVLPTIVGHKTKGLAVFLGGYRMSAIENYK